MSGEGIVKGRGLPLVAQHKGSTQVKLPFRLALRRL